MCSWPIVECAISTRTSDAHICVGLSLSKRRTISFSAGFASNAEDTRPDRKQRGQVGCNRAQCAQGTNARTLQDIYRNSEDMYPYAPKICIDIRVRPDCFIGGGTISLPTGWQGTGALCLRSTLTPNRRRRFRSPWQSCAYCVWVSCAASKHVSRWSSLRKRCCGRTKRHRTQPANRTAVQPASTKRHLTVTRLPPQGDPERQKAVLLQLRTETGPRRGGRTGR